MIKNAQGIRRKRGLWYWVGGKEMEVEEREFVTGILISGGVVMLMLKLLG